MSLHKLLSATNCSSRARLIPGRYMYYSQVTVAKLGYRPAVPFLKVVKSAFDAVRYCTAGIVRKDCNSMPVSVIKLVRPTGEWAVVGCMQTTVLNDARVIHYIGCVGDHIAK